MTNMYVVVDDKKYPDRVYQNESEYSTGSRVMSLEDAKYTAELLGCKVYKLAEVNDETDNLKCAIHQLAELYNAVTITGQSQHDCWTKQFRNEVRHTLRKGGYHIESTDYGFGNTTRAVLGENNA